MEVDVEPWGLETRLMGPLGVSSFPQLLETLSKPAFCITEFLDFLKLALQVSCNKVDRHGH